MSKNDKNKSEQTWDDWEDAVDAGLDPVVPEKDLKPAAKSKPVQTTQPKKVEIVHQNPGYSEYVPPIRLLTRPKQVEEKQPLPARKAEDLDKKLSKRQEEYQKARNRIFNSDAKASPSQPPK